MEFWNRCIEVAGCYAFDKGENVENYFEKVGTCGSKYLATLKSYKVHVCEDNESICIIEVCDDKKISNFLRMNVEAPIRYPDDDEGNI